MDQTPQEVWERIFSFSCTDSGFTGRSLSLVSKYVRETSKVAKLQSIAIHGYRKMLAFAALLEQIPPHLRCVRYILIHASHLNRGGYRKMAMDMQRKKGADAFYSILQNVAPSLEILDVHLEYETARLLTSTITLPCLTDLTTCGYFPLLPYSPHTPILEPCQSLRRLHIKPDALHDICSSTFFPYITSFAPALTHLCLSPIQKDSKFFLDLKVALGLTQLQSGQSELARLPKTIDKILLRVTAYDSNLLDGCRELQEDGRVVLLRALSNMLHYNERVNNRDWLDVREEYWATSDVDEWIRGGLEPCVTVVGKVRQQLQITIAVS